MQPYQQRVIDERQQLRERLDKLENFLAGDLFRSLNHEEGVLLWAQRGAMAQYLAILDRRVANWKDAAATPTDKAVGLRAEIERLTAELEDARRAPVGVLAEVAAERARQVAKGYTAEHDDGAEQNELAELAGLLLLNDFDLCDIYPDVQIQAQVILDKYDEDRRRQIIIALALGLAEVERQDRLRARTAATVATAPE